MGNMLGYVVTPKRLMLFTALTSFVLLMMFYVVLVMDTEGPIKVNFRDASQHQSVLFSQVKPRKGSSLVSLIIFPQIKQCTDDALVSAFHISKLKINVILSAESEKAVDFQWVSNAESSFLYSNDLGINENKDFAQKCELIQHEDGSECYVECVITNFDAYEDKSIADVSAMISWLDESPNRGRVELHITSLEYNTYIWWEWFTRSLVLFLVLISSLIALMFLRSKEHCGEVT